MPLMVKTASVHRLAASFDNCAFSCGRGAVGRRQSRTAQNGGQPPCNKPPTSEASTVGTQNILKLRATKHDGFVVRFTSLYPPLEHHPHHVAGVLATPLYPWQQNVRCHDFEIKQVYEYLALRYWGQTS